MPVQRKTPWVVSGALTAVFSALFIYAWMAPPLAKIPGPLDRNRFMTAQEGDIRAKFNDPESVRFRSDAVFIADQVPVLCGEINYRNSTNGYVGFRRFVYGPKVAKFEDAPGSDEMTRLWLAHCKNTK